MANIFEDFFLSARQRAVGAHLSKEFNLFNLREHGAQPLGASPAEFAPGIFGSVENTPLVEP